MYIYIFSYLLTLIKVNDANNISNNRLLSITYMYGIIMYNIRPTKIYKAYVVTTPLSKLFIL